MFFYRPSQEAWKTPGSLPFGSFAPVSPTMSSMNTFLSPTSAEKQMMSPTAPIPQVFPSAVLSPNSTNPALSLNTSVTDQTSYAGIQASNFLDQISSLPVNAESPGTRDRSDYSSSFEPCFEPIYDASLLPDLIQSIFF